MLRGLFGTLGIWAVGAAVLRTTIVAPQTCPPVTADEALEAAKASAEWIERAQNADGTYLYEYDGPEGRDLGGYNVVRHAGVTMSLYQQAASGDLSVLPAADRGLGYMERNLLRRDGWAAFRDPASGRVQLGASALLLAGLTQRRIATGDDRYDDLMRDAGKFLVVMQREDGAFLNYWLPETGAPDPTQTSKYATGEAFWALTLMHRLFPGEGWDEPAWKVADYLSLYRDEVEQNKFPPWADQWAAYGLGEMAGWGLKEHNIAYARSLAERFGFLVRVESFRTDSWWSEALHGRQARAAGMGTWVEGLTSLHRLASVDPRMADLEDDIAERAACGAGMLAERQVSPEEAGKYPEPQRAEGAWFTQGITRMDDQQHALSGLLYSAPMLEAMGRRDE